MNFKPVTVSDYDTLKPFFTEHPYNLSIYSPASLIAWSNLKFRSLLCHRGRDSLHRRRAEDHPEDHHLIFPFPERVIFAGRTASIRQRLGFEQYWYAPGDYLETLDRLNLKLFFY